MLTNWSWATRNDKPTRLVTTSTSCYLSGVNLSDPSFQKMQACRKDWKKARKMRKTIEMGFLQVYTMKRL